MSPLLRDFPACNSHVNINRHRLSPEKRRSCKYDARETIVNDNAAISQFVEFIIIHNHRSLTSISLLIFVYFIVLDYRCFDISHNFLQINVI